MVEWKGKELKVMVECDSVNDGDIRWVVLRYVFQHSPLIEIPCNISDF